MEAETPLLSGSWTRGGGHVQQLELLNAAAEKVHFYRQLLLHVDDQLNRARLALGAYRRGEVGPGKRSFNRRSGSSTSDDLKTTSHLVTGNVTSAFSEEQTKNKKKATVRKEEKNIPQHCCYGVDGAGEGAGACNGEYYLLGTTFIRADSAVICTFLLQRIKQLEARRDTYRRDRKAAVAALLQLNPSITDLAEAEWRLLLAEPEVQRWKQQADEQEAARQQRLCSLQGISL